MTDSKVMSLEVPIPAEHFWMRSVSFLGLRELTRALLPYEEGLTPKEIATLIRKDRIFTVGDGRLPSNTTIYHYRNTLLHLNVLVREGRRQRINFGETHVQELVESLTDNPVLSRREKDKFGRLILEQPDCRVLFSDLFWAGQDLGYGLDEWRAEATPVIWKELVGQDQRKILLRSVEGDRQIELATENQIQAILYGVRYWFRDELALIDEVFRENLGNVMFPVLPADRISNDDIINHVLGAIDSQKEWTRLSIRDLIFSVSVRRRISLDQLFQCLTKLRREFPGHIVLIATARSFATLTAGSGAREQLELRGYLRDDQGAYISHIRMHKELKEMFK